MIRKEKGETSCIMDSIQDGVTRNQEWRKIKKKQKNLSFAVTEILCEIGVQ